MISDARTGDGNAIAGPLSQIFAFDVTRMIVTCCACGSETPLGALRLYGDTMGMVLRCVRCGEVNLRALQFDGRISLDARGATRMTFRPQIDRI